MLDIDFNIDARVGGRFRGWAWCPAEPALVLDIEVTGADGAVVAQVAADAFRGDLASAGKRGGRCGFHIEVPPFCASGLYTLRARLHDIVVPLTAPEPFESMVAIGDAPTESLSRTLDDGSGTLGHLDEAGPGALTGWVHGGVPFAPAIALEMLADGVVVASVTADRWRGDVADIYAGDGRVGFAIPLPAALYDGASHAIDLRRIGATRSLLRAPVDLRLGTEPPAAAPLPAPPRRPPADAPIELSIVVNFYDMAREAARTLTSLSRAFQRDIDDLAYEVICIDNGSPTPLDPAMVAAHGPEFRLIRPDAPHASPVFALNAAVADARGRFVAVMIDGAHLLSPGVLREAIAALRADAATIVAVRHWFIGGDQRWLSVAGYSRAHEDIAFARIAWPECGYDIFRIASPIYDSPNTWFDSMSESNCLFLAADAFRALGGYDEMFSTPGGGFANLDLFARAARAPGASVTALIGEASFHQYHGGTTTNVTDAEKETRVRRYAAAFTAERGTPFVPVEAEDIRLQGRLRSDFALNARQRVNVKARLGLTPRVRPVDPALALDEGARAVVRTAYVEQGGHDHTIWLGQPTGVAPADLIELQQMLFAVRPDVLVCRDVAPGLIAFVRSIMPAMRLEGLVIVDLIAAPTGPAAPGVVRIVGDLAAPAVQTAIDDAIGAATQICVLFQPRDEETVVTDTIARHARLVSAGGYIVVLGAALGQPDLGYSTHWTSAGIQRFLESGARFAVDGTMNAHIVTTCPQGFLRRLPDTRAGQGYDATIDDLEGV